MAKFNWSKTYYDNQKYRYRDEDDARLSDHYYFDDTEKPERHNSHKAEDTAFKMVNGFPMLRGSTIRKPGPLRQHKTTLRSGKDTLPPKKNTVQPKPHVAQKPAPEPVLVSKAALFIQVSNQQLRSIEKELKKKKIAVLSSDIPFQSITGRKQRLAGITVTGVYLAAPASIYSAYADRKNEILKVTGQGISLHAEITGISLLKSMDVSKYDVLSQWDDRGIRYELLYRKTDH